MTNKLQWSRFTYWNGSETTDHRYWIAPPFGKRNYAASGVELHEWRDGPRGVVVGSYVKLGTFTTYGAARAYAARHAAGEIGTVEAPRAYAHALGILRGRTSRTLATGTSALMRHDGNVTINYRGTDVATFRPDGSMRLDNGGWPTMTTKRRMDDAMRGAFRIGVLGYVLRHGAPPKSADKNPWRTTSGVAFTDVGESNVYVVNPWNPYHHESPFTGAPGWGSNYGIAPRLVCELSADDLAPYATDGTEYRDELGTFGAGRPLCAVCGERDATVKYRWTSPHPSLTSCDTCAGVTTRRAS